MHSDYFNYSTVYTPYHVLPEQIEAVPLHKHVAEYFHMFCITGFKAMALTVRGDDQNPQHAFHGLKYFSAGDLTGIRPDIKFKEFLKENPSAKIILSLEMRGMFEHNWPPYGRENVTVRDLQQNPHLSYNRKEFEAHNAAREQYLRLRQEASNVDFTPVKVTLPNLEPGLS